VDLKGDGASGLVLRMLSWSSVKIDYLCIISFLARSLAEFKQIFERFDFQVKKMQQSITEGKLTTVDEDEAVMKEEDPDVKDMFSDVNAIVTLLNVILPIEFLRYKLH